MFKYRYIFVVFFIALYSCDYFNLKKEDNGEIIASVGSTVLYKKDLSNLYENGLTVEDSTNITNNFIENWARKQIILQKATFNLSDKEETELKKMIDIYREDLYINTYKNDLVAQNLDTVVRKEEIRDFYSANQHIFRLKEEVFQYKYLSFLTESVDAKNIKKLFIKYDAIEIDTLVMNDLKFAISHLNDSTWFSYKDLTRSIPILKSIDKKRFLRKNNFIELKDSINTFFIGIKDFKVGNDIAPLEYVTPVIKQMILHKKKLTYINELNNKLIEEAIQNEIYKRY